ncbi:YesL family protein [Nonomuraea sp. K274]|uniref:YesL family protein n=1 Tax=Nonomuraea cypriaca TaxID=1187855 RepID=A0A931A4J3_9ACTN|nr:YesL family protein [Nonomuraea cypriaca]MBF8186146.1 YesL family protein [Nonomuraea cypriaca]
MPNPPRLTWPPNLAHPTRARDLARPSSGWGLPRLIRVVVVAVYLNLLWLAACLPLVTAPAATAALVTSVRDWTTRDAEPGARSYLTHVWAHRRTATGVGLILALAAALAATDLLVIGLMDGVQRRAFLVAWLAVVACGFVAAVFALPVAALERAGVRHSLRTSARLAFAAPARALTMAGTLLLAAAMVSVTRAALLVVPVAVAFAATRCHAAATGALPHPTR